MRKKLSVILATFLCSVAMIGNVQALDLNGAYAELVKDGVLELGVIKPKEDANRDNLEFWVNAYVIRNLGTYFYGYLGGCNTDYSECYLNLGMYNDNYESNETKSEKVKVVWQEENPEVKTIVDGYMDKIYTKYAASENILFELTDMPLVNYLNNISTKSDNVSYYNDSINYVKEIKDLFDGSNVSFVLDTRLGDAAPFYTMGGGALTAFYDNIAYSSTVEKNLDKYVGVVQKFIIYIPDDVENTQEAYIAAAKARIDSYLKNNNITIKAAGSLSDVEIEDYSNIDITNAGDSYYKITIGNSDYEFLIIKDSSKIETPVTVTKDIVTNVQVEFTSPDIPLDTKASVVEVVATTQEFQQFKETLKKEVLKAFDISLHSDSMGAIKKIDNGVFKVTIPLGLEFIGKKWSAYYIKDDGSIEEHPITLDATGNASFETTHFSTYIIAESSINIEEEVPKTFDKVDFYIMAAIIGAIGIFSCFVLFRTN